MLTAREVANLFLAREDEPDANGKLKVVSMRLPPLRHAYVDGLAAEAGVSRNEMLNHLIDVGIGAVLNELPDSIGERIHYQALAAAEGEG